jgi:hypothetical protein
MSDPLAPPPTAMLGCLLPVIRAAMRASAAPTLIERTVAAGDAGGGLMATGQFGTSADY